MWGADCAVAARLHSVDADAFEDAGCRNKGADENTPEVERETVANQAVNGEAARFAENVRARVTHQAGLVQRRLALPRPSRGRDSQCADKPTRCPFSHVRLHGIFIGIDRLLRGCPVQARRFVFDCPYATPNAGTQWLAALAHSNNAEK